jgi:hypothetical protein
MAATHFSGPIAIGSGSIETLTASTTLDGNDNGKTLMVATDALVITLPAASSSAGWSFTFVNSGADGNNIITVSPASADAIWGSVTLAASVVEFSGTDDKDLINTKATANKGDTATIVCDGSDWFVTTATGIWASQS